MNRIDIHPIDGELRVHDLDVGNELGLKRPRDIRKLIRRYLPEMQQLGVCATVALTSGARGGRPGEEYYLNRGQTMFIITKSEPPRH